MAPSFRELVTGARTLLSILCARPALSGPRSVALNPTNVCNTNCIMCSCHSPLLTSEKEFRVLGDVPFMDARIFEQIIRESRALGTYRVVLGGFGDPALHPKFDGMLELMKRLNMEPYVLTNGLALRVPHKVIDTNKIDWFITEQYSSQCNILEAPEPA